MRQNIPWNHETMEMKNDLHNITLDSAQTLLSQTVPQVQSSLAIPRPHDGGVDGVQIINSLLDLLHMLLPRNGDAAGHGTSEHFVAADGNGINGLAKGDLGCKVDKGHHHGEEGSVAVDVKPVPGDVEVVEDAKDAIEVVDGALDGGADVDVDDDGPIAILFDLVGEDVVVDLAHGEGGDGLGVHAVVPRRLEDAVVRLLGRVEDAVGVALPREEDAVQVALGAAGGDVPPVVALGDLPQVGEEVNHGALELAGVHAVIAGDEGVAEVVDGVLHELVQLLVVVHEVVGVAEVHARAGLEQVVVCLQDVRLVGGGLALCLGRGDPHGFGG